MFNAHSAAESRWPRRPNRSHAQRQGQYRRAQAKAIGFLLKAFVATQHPGCQATKLSLALQVALQRQPAANADSVVPTGDLAFIPEGDATVAAQWPQS